ncbi:MAG TPA: PIG-L family deacetylase [Candidatus Eremiobacteraeota bacterium]|nr:PIG-L family deacetylase [Candidatus Eremiobacteraeota bacterium]
MKEKFILLSIILLFIIISLNRSISSEEYPEMLLTENDRLLILAPHPDDEIVGCGGLIQKAIKRKIPIHILFLTYGDFNEWSFMIYRKRPVLSKESVLNMGEIRHKEALSAAKVMGVGEENLTFLGYPDFGTQEIWYRHWNTSKAYKSLLTRATEVPYKNALRPGSPYKGEEILKDIKTVLNEFKPTKIFVTHSGDNHPDHRAFYLFNSVALWDLHIKTEVYPYLVHYNKWPNPRKYEPDRTLTPPENLMEIVKWQNMSLSHDERDLKVRTLMEHKTQYEANKDYLLSFMRPNELWGDFPFIELNSNLTENLGVYKEGEIPGELLDEEKAIFVDLEKLSVKIEDGKIEFSAHISRPIAETVALSVYLFGYREGVDFSLMPKIHIKFGTLGYEIYDQNKKLSKNLLNIKRKPKDIVLSLSLSAIGNPERIFLSAETYIADIPLDSSPWRIIIIKE